MNIEKQLKKVGCISIQSFVTHCDNVSQTQNPVFKKEEFALMLRLAGSPNYMRWPQAVEKDTHELYYTGLNILVSKYKMLIHKPLLEAKSPEDLLEIAMLIIKHGFQPLIMVAGPNSTGGKGSLKENILAMQEYIEGLYESGKNVFDQTRFEEAMSRMRNTTVEYDYDLLNKFYLPILESGHIKGVDFMSNYQSSIGAKWIHEQCTRLKIATTYQE